MLHFPPEFWRILNFFSSARGKLPILPYPALCCLQYFPRTNDKYQSPYLVKHVSMVYHIVSPCNNYYNSCFIIIFCCFISFSFLYFTFLCGIILKDMPVSYSLTLISFLKTAILLFLQIRQGYDIFPLSGINEVIDFELINHCCGAHFFHDHSASASSEKDAHVSAADSIHWVKGAITNDGTCQTFSWKKLHYLLL